ncbi:MAG: hypothetical protein WCI11_20590 [Candidatus Methylumidiphilus sp.]
MNFRFAATVVFVFSLAALGFIILKPDPRPRENEPPLDKPKTTSPVKSIGGASSNFDFFPMDVISTPTARQTTKPVLTEKDTAETLAKFKEELKQSLSKSKNNGFASPELEELLNTLASASIPNEEKQTMLWELCKETEDSQKRMLIYDMLERIGSDYVVKEIIDNFDSIVSPEEQARVLDLLNRSLETTSEDLANTTKRERLEGNTEKIVELMEKQITHLNPSSPVRQKAIDLLPNIAPAEQVVETYDNLLKNNSITKTTYYDGITRAILSENETMQTYTHKYFGNLAKEEENIRYAVNKKIYDYTEAAKRQQIEIPDEIKVYIDSQKPTDYNSKRSYFDWSSQYFDWIQAKNATSQNHDISAIDTRQEPIESALIINFRPDDLRGIDPKQLETIQATLQQTDKVLPADSPHHNLYRQAISIVEEQRAKSQ